MDEPSFKVIIIGAGLSGCLLANGLLRKGIEVVVYERLSRHSKREGYQIRLGAPALKGMRVCLSLEKISDITAKFGRAGGSLNRAPVWYDHQFRTLLDPSRFEAYHKSAPISRVVLRDALAEPLFEAGNLKYGFEFSRYEIVRQGTGHERVRVVFGDGFVDEGDLLIGADGSHSRINVQLGLNNIHQIDTHMSMVAKGDLPASKYFSLSKQLQEKAVIAFAENKTLFFCVYCPEDHSGSYDDSMSSTMFGIHVPLGMCPPDLAQKSTTEKWDFISLALRGQEIISLMKGADVYVYQARASEPPPKDWRRKAQIHYGGDGDRGHPRVWLMGDAMHAMLPTRGMGGNQAMQDAATALPLIERLAVSSKSRARPTTEDISRACQVYEDEMIPRSFSWVQKSGGRTVVPLDASRFWGRVAFFLLAQVFRLASLYKIVMGYFWKETMEDDAPELRA
ncbi:FAD/NAD(P)-binding domain-containing protein [Aspergillus sergii]|uniref:FAD/NAD(P)-binding domain-containing protein n=1 Tax=Aspergillus sergii TaxID=1034303 RepID=A0A5N6WWS8_9EURO|nr:FAD/NAD(P)-binding domain-containing protein [Aspergillus sergii]